MHLVLLILMLNNILLYGYHVLFIYPCAVGDFGSLAILTALKNFLWIWVYKYICKSLLSVIFGLYPQVEMLDHILILF